MHCRLLRIILRLLGRGDFVRKNLVDLLLVLLVARVVISVLIGGTLLAEDLETVDGRNVGQRALLRIQVRVSLEEDVGKAQPKVGPVDIEVLLPRHIQLLASWTVGLFRVSMFDTYLDSGGGQLLGESDGQDELAVAEDALAAPEGAQNIFLTHHRESARRNNKPRMNEPVKVHGGLINLEEALVVKVLAVGRVGTKNHFHGFVEAGNTLFQTEEIEGVFDVVEVNLNKKLVSLQIAEPLDPAAIGGTLGVKNHL